MKTSLMVGIVCLLIAGSASSQVPVFNSYPSAGAVIFLDFDGHSVNGTSWNVDGAIHCAGAGLNATQITEVYNRVAEDYRPFNLNITTDSSRYLQAPLDKRMRVIVTTTNWWGNAGGVSFVGSFTWGDDTPCFVFSQLLNFNTKNVSEAISHEAGHTLGLHHQSTYDQNCVKLSDYNYGQGTGEIGWAPIMGVGYYQNFTLWYNGPNPYGCTNFQNELSVLTTTTGFGYRNDDHGGNFSNATPAIFVSNAFQLAGVVEQSTDQDMFRFVLPVNGRLQLVAAPFHVGAGHSGSNLDMQLALYNSAQQIIKLVNPGTELNSVIDTVLNAGTYYLKVEGTGNAYATNYASLGSYSLTANFIDAVLPLRRLELQGAVVNGQHRLNWIIDADEQVVEQSLEVSYGNGFNPLSAQAIPDRSYSNRPMAAGMIQYRLFVKFDNGAEYYSNIVVLRSAGETPKPHLNGNVITSNNLQVISPGKYEYLVSDIKGVVIQKGQLATGLNHINLSTGTAGLYLIRYNNGTDQVTEKFVRQ